MTMGNRLDGKRIMITGAAQEIGEITTLLNNGSVNVFAEQQC